MKSVLKWSFDTETTIITSVYLPGAQLLHITRSLAKLNSPPLSTWVIGVSMLLGCEYVPGYIILLSQCGKGLTHLHFTHPTHF